MDYDVCNPDSPVEDPWGGCAFHSSALVSVLDNAGDYFANITTWDSRITTSKYARFSVGSDNCVLASDCKLIDSEFEPTMSVSDDNSILSPQSSCSDSIVYIYDTC